MPVIVGFQPMPNATCPYCGDSHGSLAETGDPLTYQYRCWCGASARVSKQDPDVLRVIAEHEERKRG